MSAPPPGTSSTAPAPPKKEATAPDADRPPRRATVAWIVYDLANTLFSFVVLSFYLGPWLVQDLGAPDSAVTVPRSLAMVVVLVLAPLLGALADRTRRMPFLVASTLVAVLFTLGLGAGRFLGLGDAGTLWIALLAFFVANIGYQLGLVFYDALLPVVAAEDELGRIGSLGVGVGYLGGLLGLALGTWILTRDAHGEPALFLATGVLFLLLSLPLFLLVREPSAALRRPDIGPLLRATVGTVVRRVRALPESGARGRFLLARVLYADAVNTIILVLGIYAVTEAGFDADTTRYALLLGLGIAAAVLSAPLWGHLVDRNGPRNTLRFVLLVWALALGLVAVHPLLALPQDVFLLYGAVVGVGLAGTWSADRPLLVALVPRKEVGGWFGLYAMAGRFAAVVGPLLWSLVVDVAALGRPTAVLLLLVMVLAAWWVLGPLEDPQRPDDPGRRLVPWGDGSGRPRRSGWRRLVAAPATLTYLGVSWALFLPFAAVRDGILQLPAGWTERWAYAIPDLTADPWSIPLHIVTAPLVNHDLVQLVYVTVLLGLFGVPFEAREGTRRFLLVFFGVGALAAILAGVLLHVVYPGISTHPVLATAWSRTWSGGSAGAFGIMGALAARAPIPWPLLGFFLLWETNVGWWYLRSYTPAFHVTALLVGFALVRSGARPRAHDGTGRAAADWSGGPSRGR